ncbi:hypothetical protein EJ06DRAFT_520556 [Trichodelitschia bisporula]|uniref:M protein, serotype 2.1 n=1 Tax=Trichodelitschia bisporula TaxID=703511 RepID=A0A6G1I3Q8_9PEZI|nr:hypothetical protein EJ06DRAFT_520556 [Trichodelitschia bisporula]
MSANVKKHAGVAAQHSPASGRNSPAGSGRPASPSTTGTTPGGQGTPRKSTAGPASASTTTGSPNGVTRSRSVRTTNGTPISARAAVKRPSQSSNLIQAMTPADEDARIEAAALIEDLKTRLQKTESATEEYAKQVQVLQARLDESTMEQGRLEERVHEEEERVQDLENEKRESVRQRRELEAIYETERATMIKEKEATQRRDEELQGIIARLKESLAQRDSRPGLTDEKRLSRTASYPLSSSPTLDAHFAPPSSLQRTNSKNNSKLVLQKDKMIESLRLELAEAQIKLVEMENMGGGRMQELERTLLEARMTNARLMEDNESYQLLLGEKTLNGDFARTDILRSTPSGPADDHPAPPSGGASLADELSLADDSEAHEDDAHVRRLEAELATQKDQNKALTLYINKIIERILQHQGGYENILSNSEDPDPAPAAAQPPPPPPKDKVLPPPPKDASPSMPPPAAPASSTPVPAASTTFLQRAKSVAIGGARQRPRPTTYTPAAAGAPVPGVTEDPNTAPRVPLQRTRSSRLSTDMRRTTGEWSGAAAAVLVGNMYRGGEGSPRTSVFMRQASGGPGIGGGVKEGVKEEGDEEDPRKAALEALTGSGSGEKEEVPSPPRSVASGTERAPQTGAVMAGNKPRPLRGIDWWWLFPL